MTTTPVHRSGSQVVAALENAWRQLQKVTPDLPDVVLIVGSGAASGEWGHTWADRWVEGHPPTEDDGASLAVNPDTRKTEVFMSGERLACGARLTLQTLAHEAAHVLARVRGIKDTSRQGRYHNREFVKLAGLYGLAYPEGTPGHQVIGFSAVVMTDEAARNFKSVIVRLDKAIKLYLPGFSVGTTTTTVALPRRGRRPGTGKGSPLVKAVCSCDTPRIIRVAPATLAIAPITCGECGEEFVRI